MYQNTKFKAEISGEGEMRFMRDFMGASIDLFY